MSNFDRTQGMLHALEMLNATNTKPGERKETARLLHHVASERLANGVNPDYQRGIIRIVEGEM